MLHYALLAAPGNSAVMQFDTASQLPASVTGQHVIS